MSIVDADLKTWERSECRLSLPIEEPVEMSREAYSNQRAESANRFPRHLLCRACRL